MADVPGGITISELNRILFELDSLVSLGQLTKEGHAHLEQFFKKRVINEHSDS